MYPSEHLGNDPLEVHFSADPDDAFAWWGALEGQVATEGIRLLGVPGNVHRNNRACLDELPDIAAISAASYPGLARHYAILSSGASVGRGYGPALVAQEETSFAEALSGPIAVAGAGTTGGTLLRVLFPDVTIVEYPWREIPDAVARGEASAGVAIHETLLLWRETHLRRIACLGCLWQEQTSLPIPVGLVVGHRRLGLARLQALNDLLRRSVEFALAHRTAALEYAAHYSLAPERGTMEHFIDCFTNTDTVDLPEDAQRGLHCFFERMHELGLSDHVPELDFVGSDSRCERLVG